MKINKSVKEIGTARLIFGNTAVEIRNDLCYNLLDKVDYLPCLDKKSKG